MFELVTYKTAQRIPKFSEVLSGNELCYDHVHIPESMDCSRDQCTYIAVVSIMLTLL